MFLPMFFAIVTSIVFILCFLFANNTFFSHLFHLIYAFRKIKNRAPDRKLELGWQEKKSSYKLFFKRDKMEDKPMQCSALMIILLARINIFSEFLQL
jgi:hypothetical protein